MCNDTLAFGRAKRARKFWGSPIQKTGRCNLVIEFNFEDNIEDSVKILCFVIFVLDFSISPTLALCSKIL